MGRFLYKEIYTYANGNRGLDFTNTNCNHYYNFPLELRQVFKTLEYCVGRYSVDGAYTRVDYIAGEGPSYMVSYGYTVDDKKYFGAINRSILSMSLLLSIEENVEKLQKEYLTGRTVKVFYFKESPAEHWLDVPPAQLLVFFKAIGIPLLILILSNAPLLFIDYLIIYSPYS